MKCLRCSAQANEGKRCCASCLEKQSAWQRKARRRKRRAGLCLWCNQTALPGKRLCAEHAETNKENKRANSISSNVPR